MILYTNTNLIDQANKLAKKEGRKEKKKIVWYMSYSTYRKKQY